MLSKEKIIAFVEEKMSEWKVPGLSIAILKDDDVLLSQGFGIRNMKENKQVDDETLFCGGSITKAFTAVSIGALIDDGILDWDEPIKKYLPDLKLWNSTATELLTLKDILTHTTGLVNDDKYVSRFKDLSSREEIVKRLQYIDDFLDIRKEFCYCNIMYMFLGYLIEKITEKTWEDFMRERIFIPLGMEKTNFFPEKSRKMENFAYSYCQDENDNLSLYNADDFQLLAPAGGILTNAKEMINWLKLNLYPGRYSHIISEKSLRKIHFPHIVIPGLPTKELGYDHYSFGWRVRRYKKSYVFRHGGSVLGYKSDIAFIPDIKLGVFVTTNLQYNPLPLIISSYIFDLALECEITNWNERFQKIQQKNVNSIK